MRERSPIHPTAFRGPLSPLNVAAYLTWTVLAWSAVHAFVRSGRALDAQVLLGAAGSLAVLALFVWRDRAGASGLTRAVRQRRLIVAQIPCALLACWGLRDGLQPILLVLVAAQLAAVQGPRAIVAWLLPANLVLAVILATRYGWRADVAISMAAMVGFQAFAALCAGYAAAAERARDAALQAQAQLRAAQVLLAEGARGDERLRLSRELHDVAGHKLTALKLHLALATRHHADDETLRLCRQLADELLQEVRAVVGTLRRDEGIDLRSAIAALALPLAGAGPRIELRLDEQVHVADLQRAQTLLRCAQEGLTNALRHSGARRVRIGLRDDGGWLELRVEDDGRGPGEAAPGHGLAGMRERLAALGGQLEFGPAASGGAVLRVRVPSP